MSTQTLLTPSLVTKETLVMLENNLVAAGKVNRQFENQFYKIGSAITVRKPNRFKVTSGPALSIQNIVEPSTSITLSNHKHVDCPRLPSPSRIRSTSTSSSARRI